MRVVHILHNSFENDSRVLKELESLNSIQAIHDIYLLCTSSRSLKDEELLLDKVYINRLKDPMTGSISFLRKGIGFFIWIFAVLRKTSSLKPQILHCHDLTGLIIGFLFKLKNKNIWLIYDSHEFQIEVKNLTFWKKYILFALERITIFYVDSFITVSESIALNYEYRYGIKNPVLILNCPKEVTQKETISLKQKFNLNKDDPLFIYQGSLSRGRGIELILEAFKELPSKNIVFMGNGPLEKKIIEESNQHKNIHYHESVPVSEVLKYTSSADVGICLTDRSCLNHIFCLPNKFFEYINAGVPVICNNLFETNKIMSNIDIGVILNEETARELKEVVSSFESSQMKKKNLATLSKTYNWNKQEIKLIDLYAKIISSAV